MWSNNSTSEYTSKRAGSKGSDKDLRMNVRNSTIHSSQELEITQISIDRWMDQQNVAYTYNGILLTLKKEGKSVTSFNTGQS